MKKIIILDNSPQVAKRKFGIIKALIISACVALSLFTQKAQAQCYANGITPANLTGAPDGVYSTPSAGGLIVDMGITVSAGTDVDIYVLSTLGLANSYKISTSLDNVTFTAPVTITLPTSMSPYTIISRYTLTANAKYLKFDVGNGGVKIDAINACPTPTCSGVSSTGGNTPANSNGATDFVYNGIGNITPVTVDMGMTGTTGTVIDIYVYSTIASTYDISTSADNITFTTTTSLAAAIGKSTLHYTLLANARYVKVVLGAGIIYLDAINFCPGGLPCVAPILTASALQATCTSGAANTDASLILNTFDANAKKVDYTIGGTYTGAGFASATTVGTAPYTVVNTLPNPVVNQPYTMRVFCDATTYTDKTVILMPKQCAVADLSLIVSPATQTGNAGEYLTYTVTLTNAGPDTAPDVQVNVPMPNAKATLLSATTATGTYNATNAKWSIPSLPVGNTTMTFTVKVN